MDFSTTGPELDKKSLELRRYSAGLKSVRGYMRWFSEGPRLLAFSYLWLWKYEEWPSVHIFALVSSQPILFLFATFMRACHC